MSTSCLSPQGFQGPGPPEEYATDRDFYRTYLGGYFTAQTWHVIPPMQQTGT